MTELKLASTSSFTPGAIQNSLMRCVMKEIISEITQRDVKKEVLCSDGCGMTINHPRTNVNICQALRCSKKSVFAAAARRKAAQTEEEKL